MKGRSSGILLPVFSLPGSYGIGTLGSEARAFVDFLAEARQHVWQILPLVPPGSGDSPYMSPSAFAGNPLLLDLDDLAARGLLTSSELESARFPDPDRVDYAWLHKTRLPLLRLAWRRGLSDDPDRAQFEAGQAGWLQDHALFSALHAHFGCPLPQWPDKAVKNREPDALAHYRALLSEEIDFHIFLQYHFFRQWAALKEYANQRGISILGDLPIYVSADSADVWAHPQLFQVDGNLAPTAEAGVPPDDLCADGQHWGNPLYDWEGHREGLFAWWAGRMKTASQLYDMVRIDHFRGIHTYWTIPRGAASALEGHWEPGPGQPLLDYLSKAVPQLELIAEDLGNLDEDARAFISRSGLPGMRILVYAFDPEGESSYLPHNCPPESVIYTGTHDTPTFVQWLFQEASRGEQEYATRYLRLRADEGFGWGAVCGAWMAPSRLAIAPLQDVLGLGADARINVPGSIGPENWSWRVRSAALNSGVAQKLGEITRTYRRG